MTLKKSTLQWFLKLVVGLILIIAIYRHIYSNNSFFTAFMKVEFSHLVWAALFMVYNIGMQFIRWRFLLQRAYPEIPNQTILSSLLFGITLGLATPGNIGELGRGIYFRNYDRWLITGLTMIDKFSGVLVMSLIGIVSVFIIILLKYPLTILPIVLLSVLIFLIVAIFITIVMNPRWIAHSIQKLPGKSRFREKIINMASALNYLNRLAVMTLLVINLLWIGGIIIQFYILITAFTQISFFYFFLSVTAMYFTKILLPFSVADLGIREGLAIFYFSLFGADKSAVFNASLLILVFNIIIPAIIGSYFLFKLRLVKEPIGKPAPEEILVKRK
jgi:uncharacterized membrane protein YbhN (UPF0104 family)